MKNLLNLGTILNKTQQKKINGGGRLGGGHEDSGCISTYQTCFLGPNHGCPTGQTCMRIRNQDEISGGDTTVIIESYENLCVCP